MSDTETVIPGRRTIRRVPIAEPDKRREGMIDHEQYRTKIWAGGSVGEVVDQMSKELGKIPDEQYHVVE